MSISKQSRQALDAFDEAARTYGYYDSGVYVVKATYERARKRMERRIRFLELQARKWEGKFHDLADRT